MKEVKKENIEMVIRYDERDEKMFMIKHWLDLLHWYFHIN